MPKAIRFNQLGGPEVLYIEDLPERRPGSGEALLKVEAVGLNRAESMYYHGFYMEKVNPPSGSDTRLSERSSPLVPGSIPLSSANASAPFPVIR